MFRFLLSRRWLGLLLVVIVLGVACVFLSRWQFHRYAERAHENQLVRDNLAARPVPAASVFSTHHELAGADEWRPVKATGRYDPAHQVLVLYRSRQGANGVDVVVPLVTPSGVALLVDRGWLPNGTQGSRPPRIPPPPRGTVTVTGWARVDSTDAADEITPAGGAVRAISALAIGKQLPYPVYGGFVERTAESPQVSPEPAKAEPPDLSGGPSFFYGIQWLFFAVLFFGFWCYFAYAEYQAQAGQTPVPRADAAKVTAPE